MSLSYNDSLYLVRSQKLVHQPPAHSILSEYALRVQASKTGVDAAAIYGSISMLQDHHRSLLPNTMGSSHIHTVRTNESDSVMALCQNGDVYHCSHYDATVTSDKHLSAFQKLTNVSNFLDENERVIAVEVTSSKRVVLTNKRLFVLDFHTSQPGEGIPLPVLQDPLDRFKFVRCSSRADFFFVGTEMGKVYCYGRNSNEIFGNDCAGREETLTTFRLQEFLSSLPSPVDDIECGYLFAVARCKNGDCFGCGYNCYCNIGIDGDRTVEADTFKLVEKLKGRVKQHACGSFHTAYITFDNELWICGLKSDGQLGSKEFNDEHGNSDCVNLVQYTIGNITRFKSVCCSGYGTFILTETNDLICCGKTDHFELGQGIKTGPHHALFKLENSEMIGDFGMNPNENIRIAVLTSYDYGFVGFIHCRSLTGKSLGLFMGNLKKCATSHHAQACSDITINCCH
ncbi:hypothetical protein C9374_007611 [Naegleria lovaniensis]|uniref:Uncharacterized protein n=1 Tax=Naegleria lovaniensis TaxID=51637 RepID=A0AA88KIJ9_NAELO|nr:uncharacterized protein C9374_007611 [Naegleria lovaniensis]KAG2378973.1 hypothetical protein C9374_007611 [Naegleria lovaniensis]